MANLNKTKLDASQCIVGAYDGVEEANRVIIAASTEIAIELSAADGDNIAISDGTNSLAVNSDGSINVKAKLSSAGHLAATTANPGTNWVAFASQACSQLTVSNQTGALLEFRQGGSGVGFQVPPSSFYTFFGIANASQLEVRRADTSNVTVTFTARWEA